MWQTLVVSKMDLSGSIQYIYYCIGKDGASKIQISYTKG